MAGDSDKDIVRFGIVGTGGIGNAHCRSINAVPEARVTAVCDIVPEKAEKTAEDTGARAFADYQELMGSGEVDAIVVATPHDSHPDITIYALEKGIHVYCEKPLGVHVKDARRVAAAAKKSSAKFAIGFQMRTYPAYRRVKGLIECGELGELHRIVWQATHTFRSHFYYDRDDWRGTWSGEGGGVLLNQHPHILDQFQWYFGMPRRVWARVEFGKYHDIEVEDDVTAVMEYDDGKTAVYIATTGDSPGTNRLDVAGDRGRLVLENDRIVIDKLPMSLAEFSRTTDTAMTRPDTARIEHSFPPRPNGYELLMRNFVNAILRDEPLLAPGEVGVNSLELSNAMVLSGARQEPVTLPLDGDAYEEFLNEQVARHS